MKRLFNILELKEISNVLNQHRNFDINRFTQYQMKRNMSFAMQECRILNFQDFLKSLKDKDEIFFTALDYVFNEKVALYREPALWRMFRDEIFPKIISSKIHVWFPDFNIEDLYTFIHLIENEKIESKFSITASHFNPGTLAMAKTSLLTNSDIIQAESNYKRYDPDADNSFDIKGTTIKIESDFIKSKVHFINKGITDFKSIGKFNLVFYRNRLLYYKINFAQQNLNHISELLKGGGFLFLGTGENINIYNVKDAFATHNKEESIYKRKF